MDIERVKELNEYIIDKATEKIDLSMKSKGFDEESFEVLSKAIVNLKYLEKIEHYEEKEVEESEEVEAAAVMPKLDASKVTTEFEGLIYEIARKLPGKDYMLAITTIIADTMEDLRVLHPKMYENLMRKLKEVLY